MIGIIKSQPKWSESAFFRELLYVLVLRHLKVRYRGSALGIYWSLLNPLSKTVLYAAIFGKTFSSYFGNSLTDYIFSSFVGLTVIVFFISSTSQSLTSVVANGSLLNKIKIPMSIFPVSVVLADLFQFFVATFPLLFILTLIKSHNVLNLLSLFVPVISLTMASMGVSFLLSALYVFFRDLINFYELLSFIIWTASPIYFPLSIAPENVKRLLYINPLLPIIESMRQISLSNNLPDIMLMAHSLLSGIIVLAIGWIVFQNLKSQFMDLL